MLETKESRNRTNTIRLPLESLRYTESDSFVPQNENRRWPDNLMQGSCIHPRHSYSSDWQTQSRREEQPTGRIPAPPPVPYPWRSGSSRNVAPSPFRPVEKPTTHSESPTGLFKPPPIALSEWNRRYGFPGTRVPDKEIGDFIRPSSVKKVVANIRNSDQFSKSQARSPEEMNKNQSVRETNKSPEIRYAMSTNCIYEADSTKMRKKIYPNTSDPSMYRVLSPSLLKSPGEDLASLHSSSDHTIVGHQSITTDDTLTEERLAALNDSGDLPCSSGSHYAPPQVRGSVASSSGSVCTAQLVSNRRYGFPGTRVPDKEIGDFIRPSSVKKVVANIRNSDQFSKSQARSPEEMNKNQSVRETNKSPEIRYAISTNCIYEADSTKMRKIVPNTSDPSMYRVLSPSLLKSPGEDLASLHSSSDHTIVGHQSITTDETLTEERLAALNDSGDLPCSSGSQFAPPQVRGSVASSSGSVCTAQLVSRSPTSDDSFYIAPQSDNYYAPHPNTRVYTSDSWSTNSYESAINEPISTSTRKSSPASDGSTSVTSSTSKLFPVSDGRSSGTSSTRKSSPGSDGRASGNLSTRSSQYLINNDAMMRKKFLPPFPNESHGYFDKMQNETLDQRMHFAEIGSYYKKCYDHGKISDVRFCLDDDVLYAHRGALCTVSPYFESIFIENSSIRSKAMADIRLRGLSIQSLQSFLNFVYTGQLEITSSTILDLIKISMQFQIPLIRERCLRQLKTLPHDDIVMLLVAVRKDTVHDFITPILRCISKRFLDISECKSSLELDVGTLCVILTYDELVTSSEMEVFCAGLKWINACPDEREQYLETVMKCVRFPLMPQQDLVQCIDRCSLLTSNENCLNMIYKANWIRTVMELNRQDPLNLNIPDARYLTGHENSNNSTNHFNNNATPVNMLDISFGSIESFHNDSMYTESFTGSRQSFGQPSPIQDGNFGKKHNTNQIPKPDLNENSSMIVLDQKLYVIGGLRYSDDNPLPRRDVWVYSPERGWQKLTSLRTARMHHALCVFDGCIYAIGGLGRNGRILKSVECYNPSTNSWHFVKSLSTPRTGACAAELDGEIFVAGGFGYSPNGNSTILDSVECYHACTDRWVAKGSLRYGRCHATMTCIENGLYLSGGLAFDQNSSVASSVQDVDLYDANTDSWMLRTYLDKARHSAASFASGNKLYLIGGLSTNQRENLHDDIECWDVQRNAWLSTFKLPTEVQWMKSLA